MAPCGTAATGLRHGLRHSRDAACDTAATLPATWLGRASAFPTGTLKSTRPPRSTAHALCESLPTSKPRHTSYPDQSSMLHPPSWSAVRGRASPTPTLPSRRCGRFLSVVLARRPPSGGNTPWAFARGSGRRPSGGGRSAAPQGRQKDSPGRRRS